MTEREIEYFFGVKDPSESKSDKPFYIVVDVFTLVCSSLSVCGSERKINEAKT